MSELNALLMTSIQDSFPLTQYFPLNCEDKKIITELLIISNHFKSCGKGCLQYNNKLFFYKTYIPILKDSKINENESLSNTYSDYFLYNLDCNKKKFFLLFYCGLNYNQKDIDNLTNDIFEIFDEGAFEGHSLKKDYRDKINNIFQEYQKLSPKLEEQNILTNIDQLNKSNEEKNQIKEDKSNPHKKRIDSRIVVSTLKKTKTFGEVSADIDDITSIKDSETNTNLSIMFKYNINEENYGFINKNLKKIKILNMLFCFIVLLIAVFITIMFFS